MIESNMYIVIPAGALFCFAFLFFCFLNISKAKIVSIFRLLIVSCIFWTGGALLMRLQVKPGMDFWFQVSFFGLLMLPLLMYFFLFETLGIQKTGFLYVSLGLSSAAVIINAITHSIVATPTPIIRDDSGVGYTYRFSIGIVILLVFETFLLVYATYLAYKKIGLDMQERERLFPLLLGTCAVLFGQIFEMLPRNVIPFGSLGGVLLAISVIYVLYQKSTFDISERLLIGCVYTVAAAIIFFTMWGLSKGIKSVQRFFSLKLNDTVLLILTFLTIWSLIIIYFAWKTAEGLSLRKKKEQFQYLNQFQNGTVSLFNEEELYKKIIEVIHLILGDVRTMIFMRKEKDGAFVLIPTCEDDYGIDFEEKEQIIAEFFQSEENRSANFARLQYDDIVWGFIYLKFPAKAKVNYTEVEYINQVAAYASICLKNISIYQEVYQNSIHDEMTGLYNRTYFKEFIDKFWMPHARQSFIYLKLDDFKLFNELYGEDKGDEILKWSGNVISETVGSKGATFRIGSNEFLVYSRYRNKEELIELSREIQKGLMREDEAKPKVLQPITMSVGIALFPDTATDADMLLKQAEKANFFAREDGKHGIKVYEVNTNIEEEEIRDLRSYEQLTPTIYALTAAIDAKDSYTFKHSISVSEYAVLLAKKIGLSSDEVRIVKEAGLLHDIGKIGIPENILKKQGKLTDEEYAVMKTHVANSIEMIHYLPNMSYVIPAVVSHHERYDGKGYPRGIAGEEIPLLGRVLAVCDSYEAIISERPYKEAMTAEYAISELERNKGTQFDPELVDAFISLVKEGKLE